MKEYMKNRRAKRRALVLEMLGDSCARCGSTEELEVNHIDRVQKVVTLSGAGLDRACNKIVEEIKKCELLCIECHKDYTRGQWKRREIPPSYVKHGDVFYHGTARMYNEKNCRCEDCKLAKKYYRNGYISYADQIEVS